MVKAIEHSVVACVLLMMLANLSAAQESGLGLHTVPPLKAGFGDLIELTIYDNPDLSGRFRVDEKGDVFLPLLGPVNVVGNTAEEIGRIIEKRYSESEILRPNRDYATVFISEYASQGITVSGEVKTPGVFPALGVRMLHDVISAAGGVLTTASSKVIVVRKTTPEQSITVEYNPEALSPLIPQFQILPGDTIMVPRAGMVYVLGNVTRPGAYILGGRDNLTVEQAIALAGNTGKAASTKGVHLIRTEQGGRKLDAVLRLNLILKGKAPDVAMKDGDILYVPTSNVKLATQQAIISAVGIGTSVAVYKTAYQ